MKILVLDSGGRGHALAWKLVQEGHNVTVAPGNAGIALTIPTATLDLRNISGIHDYVRTNRIEYVVVGPEAPLAAGIVDHFRIMGIAVFGPTKDAAQIETSKIYCQRLLEAAGVSVPHASIHQSFNEMWAVAERTEPPFVIKYAGLASGKGVEVVLTSNDRAIAHERLKLLPYGQFLIQRFERGPEVSYFVLADEKDYLAIGSAADYKPLFEGGPNTGGMGGYAPHDMLTPELQRDINRKIVEPTILALQRDGCPYTGVLYFQLMLTKYGPVVIEINCRFGDPETQLLMPLLDCELLPLLQATSNSTDSLWKQKVALKNRKTVGIVLTAHGYPGDSVRKGDVIEGLQYAAQDALIFHAGTGSKEGKLVTAGGRIITCVGEAENYTLAYEAAASAASLIRFEGAFWREDIARRVRSSTSITADL